MSDGLNESELSRNFLATDRLGFERARLRKQSLLPGGVKAKYALFKSISIRLVVALLVAMILEFPLVINLLFK